MLPLFYSNLQPTLHPIRNPHLKVVYHAPIV